MSSFPCKTGSKTKAVKLIALMLAGLLVSCTKEYFEDTGLADPHYEGSIYEFLEGESDMLDTVAYIAELAGLDSVLDAGEVTFFSPTDDAVRQSMDLLNLNRYLNVEDSVFLEDLSQAFWSQFLSMYILPGKHMAKDFARVDVDNPSAYPGINYYMHNRYIMNIGLIYEDYRGVEAVGARILRLTDITANPDDFSSNQAVTVATSDILPENGVLHVLSNNHAFGFRSSEFIRVAQLDLQLNEE